MTRLDGNSAVANRSAAPAARSYQRSWIGTGRRAVWTGRTVVVVLWIGIWQLCAGRLIDPFFSSSPSSIASQLGQWFGSGTIWPQIATTLEETLIGFAIGGAAGVLGGFVMGRSVFLASVLGPFVTALYSLPKLALAPLFILWFGIGLESKVVLVALITFFLVFYNTFAGAREVDGLLVDVTRLYGANRRQIYTKIVVPSAMSWVTTGLRIAVPQALIGAIVGELISSNRGLGYLIANAASFFDTTGVLAGVVTVVAISLILIGMVSQLEKRTLRWKTPR